MTTVLADPQLFAHLGDPWQVAETLALPDVLCTGHFRLLGGAHTDKFLRFSAVASNEPQLDRIADLLFGSIAPFSVDAVVAPCTAGVALGVALARRLGVRLHLATVDGTGRADGFVRDAPTARAPVLLVNDVVTTGQGLMALDRIVEQTGAITVGGAAFLSRRPIDAPPAVPFALSVVATLPLPAWDEDDCPLCGHGNPATDALDLN